MSMLFVRDQQLREDEIENYPNNNQQSNMHKSMNLLSRLLMSLQGEHARP